MVSPCFRAASDLADLSSTSRDTPQSDDGLEHLQHDILDCLPELEEEQGAHLVSASDNEMPLDESMDSTDRIEPSGTATLGESFHPLDSSSPIRVPLPQQWDSEDEDAESGSQFSLGDQGAHPPPLAYPNPILNISIQFNVSHLEFQQILEQF